MSDQRGSLSRVELATAVEIDVGRLVGHAMGRSQRYRIMRDTWIAIDESVVGGTPVIRGSRVNVFSVFGRVQHGETISDIRADNPDLPRKAIEAALIYDRATRSSDVHGPARRETVHRRMPSPRMRAIFENLPAAPNSIKV